jgi:hypothetical protein
MGEVSVKLGLWLLRWEGVGSVWSLVAQKGRVGSVGSLVAHMGRC